MKIVIAIARQMNCRNRLLVVAAIAMTQVFLVLSGCNSSGTSFSPNYSERVFRKIAVGDSVQSIYDRMGSPLAVRRRSETGLFDMPFSNDPVAISTAENDTILLLQYTVGINEKDYKIRDVLVKEGIVVGVDRFTTD